MAQGLTVPIALSALSVELLQPTIDLTGMMGVGDVASNPVAVVQSATTNETVTGVITNLVVNAGTVLAFNLSCNSLRPGQTYKVTITFTATNGSYSTPLSVELALNII